MYINQVFLFSGDNYRDVYCMIFLIIYNGTIKKED